VVKIVDVKCPHSGEGGTFRMANLEALGERDEVKFVLSDRADYEFARDFVASTTSPPGSMPYFFRRLFASRQAVRATPLTVWSTPRNWPPGCFKKMCRRGSDCNCTSSFGIRQKRACELAGQKPRRPCRAQGSKGWNQG
jgi:hypothetical protein